MIPDLQPNWLRLINPCLLIDSVGMIDEIVIAQSSRTGYATQRGKLQRLY